MLNDIRPPRDRFQPTGSEPPNGSHNRQLQAPALHRQSRWWLAARQASAQEESGTIRGTVAAGSAGSGPGGSSNAGSLRGMVECVALPVSPMLWEMLEGLYCRTDDIASVSSTLVSRYRSQVQVVRSAKRGRFLPTPVQ